jgi:hypothetical protein
VLTERARAAQVFGASAYMIWQFIPEIAAKLIDFCKVRQKADRQALVAKQWIQVEPVLLAVFAGYPSAAVRYQLLVFERTTVNAIE